MTAVQKTAARVALLNAVALAQLEYDGAKAVGASDKVAKAIDLGIAKMALRVFDKISVING